MANSDLSFISTQSFRNALMAKNLPPYTVTGAFSPQVSQLNYESVLSSYSVVDSPNNLIAQDPFAQQLYPLNQYGPPGGYNININFNGPANVVNSNEGIYDINDTKLDLVNEFFIDAAYIQNVYGPEDGFNNMVIVTDTQNNNQIHQPYWSPPSFEPSTYTPYSILLSNNPSGSNGPLSNDSYIAKLGAERLKFAFEERIGAQLYKSTIGAIDLDSLKDPFEASLLVTGKQPLITKDYTITVPENLVLRAGQFLTRLSGTYFPVSPIPGSYFSEASSIGEQTEQTSLALNVKNLLTGGFLGPIIKSDRNGSELFLANTGNGQRSALFNNIDYNRYQPPYDRKFGGISGIIQNSITALNSVETDAVGGYYVGSKTSEPSTLTSPPNQIPVDAYGRQNQVPVYGPNELGELYENNIEKINFGLKAVGSIDGGGITGKFVWTSPKSKDGAGLKAQVGGGPGGRDDTFYQIQADYSQNLSTEIEYKKNSILDQTQRLVDSADNVSGIARLKHVGNAINQVSKVFNDGYKEITKGSKVIYYYDSNTFGDTITRDGTEVGVEYCRVFTKDTPYYTFADLQKSAGITKEGRRFSYSVLDNTFNLNIAPWKGDDSTNIVKNAKGDFYAKKYMFSLENLAWRTSSRPGFTYDDLPVCEKGPNGGRVMWFPPYDLKFNDSSSANWTPTSFLGRPEPIYTYKDTSRTGTISWKIVVDHPSVLNVLVDKQLKGQDNKKVDSILDSFFAGCIKYDLYELAKKYNTFKASELIELQEIISKPQLTKEEIEGVLIQIPAQNNGGVPGVGLSNPQGSPETIIQQSSVVSEIKDEFENLGFYFEDDYPKGSPATEVTDNFENLYNVYTKKENITYYQTIANKTFNNTTQKELKKTTEFFENVVIKNFEKFSKGENSFIKKVEKLIQEGNKVEVTMKGSASALGYEAYNVKLSSRRISSVINYFKTTSLGKYLQSGDFKIIDKKGTGENTTIPKTEENYGNPINCNEDIVDKNGVQSLEANIYAKNAMACRRVRVLSIKVTKKVDVVTIETTKPPIVTQNISLENPTTYKFQELDPKVDVRKKLKDGIGKRILRRLLSECDYFEMLREENPMVYDSLKTQLKYFNPTFHSTTPEGLNARLTFLNQCVRPGETIPVIDPDGRPKYNDALNTSFGTPPVLILRIGDFYHTKIIPKGLTISYEPLIYDMNPEGIGLQPMIANVSLSFDFIGGHGLAKPVEQLQNALSFNYYANTEIYDERAVWTEDTSALDREIFEDLFGTEILQEVEDTQKPPERRGGKTIGDIATTVPVTGGETGFTTFQKVTDSALTNSKDYFTTLFNTADKICKQYNWGIWQLLCNERNYTEGNFLLADNNATIPPNAYKVEIFGKPENVEQKIQYLFEQALLDIRTGINNFIIKKMSEGNLFLPTDIERLRVNYEEYFSSYYLNYATPLFDAIQIFTIFQQDMVQNFRKLNVVNSRTDGKILDNGTPFVYTLDSTNEVTQQGQFTSIIQNTIEELKVDYQNLGIKYNDYKTLTEQVNSGIVNVNYPKDKANAGNFLPLTVNLASSSIQDKRLFMTMSSIFADDTKLLEFKEFLLRQGLKQVNKFEIQLTKACEEFRLLVKAELDAQVVYFKKFKDSQEFINFEKFDTFPPNKVRKFKYTTVKNTATLAAQEKLVKDVWSDVNVTQDNKKTWDGKIKFD